jgi:hypothetical protein
MAVSSVVVNMEPTSWAELITEEAKFLGQLSIVTFVVYRDVIKVRLATDHYDIDIVTEVPMAELPAKLVHDLYAVEMQLAAVMSTQIVEMSRERVREATAVVKCLPEKDAGHDAQ